MEKVSGYKCINGQIHETKKECAECNATLRLADHLMNGEEKNRSFLLEKLGVSMKEYGKMVGKDFFATTMRQEVEIVAHWVIHSPELLETVIRLYLDESIDDTLVKK